jgi:hypothetical protein
MRSPCNVSVCLFIPLIFIVFYAVHAVSKEIRRFVLRRVFSADISTYYS